MSMKKFELTIDEKARGYAGIYASMIKDDYQRRRANAAITVLFAYAAYLKKNSAADVQNSMTLYRNPAVCSEFETADFYVNNYHLDVRVTFSDEAVLIPKIHIDNGIEPDFYAAVKIDSEIETAELIGIIDTSSSELEPFDDKYYLVKSSNFISNEEFLERIKDQKKYTFSAKEHENFNENYLSFIDGGLEREDALKILQHIFKCAECRTEFCCFTGFEMVNCNAAKYPDLIEDNTLNVIGAQNLAKYENKESAVSKILKSIPDSREEKSSEMIMIDEDDEEDFSDGRLNIIDELFSHETGDEPSFSEAAADDDDNEEAAEGLASIEEYGADEEKFSRSGNTEAESGAETAGGEIEEIKDADFTAEKRERKEEKSVPVQGEEELLDVFKEDNQENKESLIEEINDDDEDEELDIMDQMFVDGALEREVQEHEALSYNNIADNGSKTEAAADIQPENDVKQESAESIAEKTAENNSEEKEPAEIRDNPPENQTSAEAEEILETENEILEDDTITEDDKISEDDTILEDEAVSELPSDILEISEEDEKTNQAETIEVQESKKNTETDEDKPVQMFDEYIKSELEKETSSEYNNERNDNDDDDAADGIENEGESSMSAAKAEKSPLKKIILIIAAAAAMLAAAGAGAYFYIQNKNVYEENTSSSANDEDFDSELITVETIDEDAELNAEKSAEKSEQAEETSVKKALAAPVPSEKPKKEAVKKSAEKTEIKSEKDLTAADIKKIHLGMPKAEAAALPSASAKSEAAYNQKPERDINKAITNALAMKQPPASLKEINWFCNSDLAADKAFKTYMQELDNTLKQNLKINILGLTQAPYNNQITAKFAVDNNRNLVKVLITESSNSEEADKIVLQSINETFEGEKSPILSGSPLKADIYYFKVVIKL